MGSARLGLAYAVAAAAGFAAVKTVLTVLPAGDEIGLVRSMISAPAQLFFAGVWGYALGAARLHDHWFRAAWFVSMLLHGLYDHIVWGRGPGLLVAALPMLLFMVIGTVMALRAEEPVAHLAIIEPPTIEAVRARLAHPERPVMLRWIIAGAFVTLGLIVALVAGAIVLGNRFASDFSLADEADVRSSGPLLLLGIAVLAAFPLSGLPRRPRQLGTGLARARCGRGPDTRPARLHALARSADRRPLRPRRRPHRTRPRLRRRLDRIGTLNTKGGATSRRSVTAKRDGEA